jgi:hypothetical protein
VKKNINCTQEIFSKRNTRAGGQLFSYYLIIGGSTKGFTTEDKFLKPHVQNSDMVPIVHSALLHMLSNITRSSTYVLGLQMMGRLIIPTTKKNI